MPGFIIYAFLISVGILGVGNYFWFCLKQESRSSHPYKISNNFEEDPFLSTAISWFLGYFFYEAVLSTMVIVHVFYPPLVTLIGLIITLAGAFWIRKQRNNIGHSLVKSFSPAWLIIGFLLLAGFLFFWNLYPAFDVDSLAFYFTAIKTFLSDGGKNFSPFWDIRYSVPLGENYVFALGFALNPDSTLFTQVIHGISKTMFLTGVFGAARSLKAGAFALIAAALVVSEEHLLASGANISVRINMPLTFGVFLGIFSLYIFSICGKKEFLVLSVLAGLQTILCKYLGVAYLGLTLLIICTWLLFHKTLSPLCRLSFRNQPKTFLILAGMGVAAALPYLHNAVTTGSPFFPASIGPFQSWYYDSAANELARLWHYHLGLMDAMKHVTAFMVWPGILPSKILLPLALAGSFLAAFTNQMKNQQFLQGMWFFMLSVILIIINEIYMVFEMRYYRYGIGIFALSCTFLLVFIFQTVTTQWRWIKNMRPLLKIMIIVLICGYSLRYSFNVMGSSRPGVKDIIAFLTRQTSEKDIIRQRRSNFDKLYTDFKAASVDSQKLGYFLPFSWPHALYPIEGKNIAFINSSAFSSQTYFNEGLFAEALLKNNIQTIYNQLVRHPDYPLPGGAVHKVLTQCGQPLLTDQDNILRLSTTCLEEWALKKDIEDANTRLNKALEKVRDAPAYEPFNPPPYGGPSGVVK